MSRERAYDGRGPRKSQRGAALLLTLALMGLLVALFVVVLVNDLVRENTRRQQTAEALAKAKEALIGFAVGVNVNVTCGSSNCPRPGDLPCPDINDDGMAETGCGGATGSNQQSRLGRLPWRTLGLPDLRDGDGERLWYAVSNNFKENTRTDCTGPSNAGCLNSSTPGTITLSDRDGTIVHDGSDPNPPSGVIAVIIAPGAILQRDGAGSPQVRSCTGGACTPAGDTAGVCTSANPKLTAKCNPVNYLDVVSGGEDNADFIDGDSFNGFINGPVLAGTREIVNDAVLAIKYEDVMPLLERRVAREAMNCLTAYANASEGRYPWAASVGDYADGQYNDVQGRRFGRMPDTFSSSILGLISSGFLQSSIEDACDDLIPPGLCMSNKWPTGGTPACTLHRQWWTNWKEQVFYGVAEGYQPAVTIIGLFPTELGIPTPAGCSGDCLIVNPPSAANDKRVVVVVAGKKLSGQSRAAGQQGTISNYLEGANATYDTVAPTNFRFAQQPATSTFNDYVLYQ
ncbi:MAG TPA: hypothetical protein VF460_15200 [Burkholderiales bacterium]